MNRRWLSLISIGLSVAAVVGHLIVMNHDYDAAYHSTPRPSWSPSLSVLALVLAAAALVLAMLARSTGSVANSDNYAVIWKEATVIAILAFLWQFVLLL
jgi:hypothetical protein